MNRQRVKLITDSCLRLHSNQKRINQMNWDKKRQNNGKFLLFGFNSTLLNQISIITEFSNLDFLLYDLFQ